MARKQKKTGTILSLGSNWSHTYQIKMQSFSISFVHVWLVYVQRVPPNPRPTCLHPALCLRWDHLNFQHRLGLPNRRLHREISKVGKMLMILIFPTPSSPKCNWIEHLPPLRPQHPYPAPSSTTTAFSRSRSSKTTHLFRPGVVKSPMARIPGCFAVPCCSLAPSHTFINGSLIKFFPVPLLMIPLFPGGSPRIQQACKCLVTLLILE